MSSLTTPQKSPMITNPLQRYPSPFSAFPFFLFFPFFPSLIPPIPSLKKKIITLQLSIITILKEKTDNFKAIVRKYGVKTILRQELGQVFLLSLLFFFLLLLFVIVVVLLCFLFSFPLSNRIFRVPVDNWWFKTRKRSKPFPFPSPLFPLLFFCSFYFISREDAPLTSKMLSPPPPAPALLPPPLLPLPLLRLLPKTKKKKTRLMNKNNQKNKQNNHNHNNQDKTGGMLWLLLRLFAFWGRL